MKYRFLWGLLLSLLLAPNLQAQAQCTFTTSQPPWQAGCTNSFLALENGVPVDVFCVGQPVTFEVCQGAGTTPVYELVLGNQANLTPCNPTRPAPFTYTPTTAGILTVFVLVNRMGVDYFFRRTFQVLDRPVPDFDLIPCSGGNVLVTLRPGTSYDQYFVQAGSNPEQPAFQNNQTTFTLPANGATSVTVRGSYLAKPGCGGSSPAKTFVPLGTAPAPLLPRLVQARPGSPATLTFGNVQAPYRYTVLNDNGSQQLPIGTLTPPAASITLTGPAAGCYLLRRTDACEGDPATSQPLCALSLSVASVPGRNVLTFNYTGPVASYRVERNGTALTTTAPITSPGYEDADNVICGVSYTYRVTAVLANGAESTSNEARVVATQGPAPAAPGLYASFTPQNSVALTPILTSIPTGSTLRYRKAAGSAAPVDFASTRSGRVVGDSTALADLLTAPLCYTLRFVDVCGISSAESPASCPSILTARAADEEGNTIALSWTPFTGPGTGFTYTLQRLNPDGTAVTIGPATATDLPPNDRQVLRYRLQISGGGLPAGTFSYSNVAQIVRRPRVQIPTAFTPNGDGLNDVLEVKGRFLENYTFVIVDRNGQQVFRSSQRGEAWDGRINGRAPVNGSYVWRFQQNDEEGKPVSATGTVTILK